MIDEVRAYYMISRITTVSHFFSTYRPATALSVRYMNHCKLLPEHVMLSTPTCRAVTTHTL